MALKQAWPACGFAWRAHSVFSSLSRQAWFCSTLDKVWSGSLGTLVAHQTWRKCFSVYVINAGCDPGGTDASGPLASYSRYWFLTGNVAEQRNGEIEGDFQTALQRLAPCRGLTAATLSGCRWSSSHREDVLKTGAAACGHQQMLLYDSILAAISWRGESELLKPRLSQPFTSVEYSSMWTPLKPL